MQAGRTADGLVYFLPKTAVRFHLLIEKRTYTPGEFAKYAEKYLRLSGIGQEEQVAHDVVGCELTLSGVRDTSKCYAVKMKGGKCENAELHLSDDGVLLAVNAKPIGIKEHTPFKSAPQQQSEDPRQYLEAETAAAGSTAKMAEMTARQIHELTEHRQQLILGEADDMPQDERQLMLMLSEIDRQRNALMSLFTGRTRRDTVEHTITVCPEREVSKEVVFRLSQPLGLVDSDDLAGVPYYMTVEDIHHTNQQKYGIANNKKEGGFYLNVPGRIRLSLYREEHFLAAFELPSAQFGFVELYGGKLFKRYVTHMQLNPATGAIELLNTNP